MSPPFLTHSALQIHGLRHGFFTRQGGVSSGLLASLDCRYGTQEQAHKNRTLACAALGFAPENLRVLAQTHSCTVHVLDDTAPLPTSLQGDALVSTRRNLLLGIVTADCAPVLLADPQAGVIAAIHSGWRGTQGNICARTVAAMLALGARASTVRAVIGPCITQPNYEVGQEVYTAFSADQQRFFTPSERADHFLFDLPGCITNQLAALGITAQRTGQDTYSAAEEFFSCRRASHRQEAQFGLQLSAIGWRD